MVKMFDANRSTSGEDAATSHRPDEPRKRTLLYSLLALAAMVGLGYAAYTWQDAQRADDRPGAYASEGEPAPADADAPMAMPAEGSSRQ